MIRCINRGFSLIELSIVFILSSVILTAGLNFLRDREYQNRNEVTLKQVALITQATMDYINANNDKLYLNYLSNGRKTWLLPLDSLDEYIISDNEPEQKKNYYDGYGNNFAVLINVFSGRVYGLLVDKGDRGKIPPDFLSVLKNSEGSHAGGFDPQTDTISGIGNGWKFSAKDWEVSGVDFHQSLFVYLIRDDLPVEDKSAVSSFQVALTQSGVLLNPQVRNGGKVEWKPTFADDKLTILFQKSASIDYVDLEVSRSGKDKFTKRVYNNSVLVKPVADWINSGANIQLSFKLHNKFTDNTTEIFNFSVNVEKMTATEYFKTLFSRITFQYQTEVKSGDEQRPGECLRYRDFSTARITGVALSRVNGSDNSGQLLQPLQFKLAHTPAPYKKEKTLFFFQILSTSDTYISDPALPEGEVDISDGKCGPDTDRSDMNSKFLIYIKDYADNKFVKVSESDKISWNISSPMKGEISW